MCLALGVVGIVKAAQQVGDMRVVGLLFASILCGYAYQVLFYSKFCKFYIMFLFDRVLNYV